MAFRKEEREMDLSLTFGEIRYYCSLTDKISICMEDLTYQNFSCIDEVPHSFDHLYLIGFGMIDSEFGKTDRHGYGMMEHGIEFMLSEKTRKDWLKEQEAMEEDL